MREVQKEDYVTQHHAGAIALVGSGEYTAAMNETDGLLLATLGIATPTVAVIPTASGLEAGMPHHWNERGVAHFRALGANVVPVPLITRDDAHAPEIVASLEQADFYYFSGGNPEYLLGVLRDSPAWAVILSRHQAGAVIAGCSAGAMMLGGATIRVREMTQGQPPRWVPAAAVVPGVAVLPHFDRMAGFAGPDLFRQIIDAAPDNITLLGIDEDTALIRQPTVDGATPWLVSGRQTVVVFATDGSRNVYRAGDIITFDSRPQAS